VRLFGLRDPEPSSVSTIIMYRAEAAVMRWLYWKVALPNGFEHKKFQQGPITT
jgi:hypothetical protein